MFKLQEQLSKLIITTKHSDYDLVPKVLKNKSKVTSNYNVNRVKKITTDDEDYGLILYQFL